MPDVNISSGVDVTTAETGTARASQATPTIAKVPFLLILAIVNLCGNGFTLATIRMTRRLWTKTNFILASMLLSNVITGVFTMWYTPLILVVVLFNEPCRYNVLTAAVTSLIKTSCYVSTYHLIPVSVERYIAIVYPLQYETKFSDRTTKWAISGVWATGIFVGMTYFLWFINADLTRCIIVPVHYRLTDLILCYLPVCVCLFTCYGRILAISLRQRRRIEHKPTDGNRAPGPPLQTTTFINSAHGSSRQTKTVATLPATHANKATTGDNSVDSNDKSLRGSGPSSEPAVTSGEVSSELTQEQQRQKVKSRRREFKAVYLTAAIVGSFVVLRFPYMLGRVLASVGYNPVVVTHVSLVGGAFNFSTTWAIYAAVSKSYRRAYRQMLIRIGCCCCKNVTLQADNSLIV